MHRECGDPALLMPLLFNPQVDKEYDVTVIPHRAYYERVTADLQKAGKSAHVVNLTAPQDEDIEAVVTEIKRSRLVLSSSLHGLIVAHAYGVPALWMRVEELAGGDFKFKDYFSSVDIPAYEPLAWQELLDGGLRIEPEMLKGRSVVAQSRLKGIQRALLAYAPFRVKEKYRLKENNDTD